MIRTTVTFDNSILGHKLQKLWNRYCDEVQKAADRATDQYTPRYIDGINKVFTEAIDAFYEDYHPIYYGRIFSLYDPMVIEQSGSKLFIWMDKSRLLPHGHGQILKRGGVAIASNSYEDLLGGFDSSGFSSDALYEITYHRGWHGGPVHGVGSPVHISTPIWDDFVERFNAYKINIALPEYTQEIRNEVQKIRL